MTVWMVRAEYDPEARVWYVSDSDIPGIAADAETLETLAEKIGQMLPDLLDVNAALIADTARLSGPHSIRIVAHHERDFAVAA
ncbi:DUF1902 domain-containing protein [Sphingomonas sp. 37zxx]|uniref:DUF1902 domain-containing protein n=1 Tax=Sphingomonas sp. 37zxx TaxID=1550073 RepID=UPI00053BE763|nr:DUF1902 domain-containing protein [Sphingomonas sp. 37zxx]